jgi:chromosome segregation ATPase
MPDINYDEARMSVLRGLAFLKPLEDLASALELAADLDTSVEAKRTELETLRQAIATAATAREGVVQDCQAAMAEAQRELASTLAAIETRIASKLAEEAEIDVRLEEKMARHADLEDHHQALRAKILG